MLKSLNLIVFLIASLSVLSGCSKTLKQSIYDKPEAIFSNFTYKGSLDSDVVLIYNQGGPVFHPNPKEFPYKPLLGAPADSLKKALVIYMHQYQTKNRSIFVSNNITFENAKKYDIQTTIMLEKTVNYFKKKGKKIYLIGFSFGAFVVQDYLAKYGTNKIFGSLIGVGRLSLPEKFWKGFSRGEELFFKNGIQIVRDPSKGEKYSTSYLTNNSHMLAAGLGYKNYIKLLQNVNLQHTSYIYGENDSYVGRLTLNEIRFLKKKGVKIFRSKGGHHKAIEEFIAKGLLNLVKE